MRAWNNSGEAAQSDIAAFAHFLAIHYAGICRRTGYGLLARLMEMCAEDIMYLSLGIQDDHRKVELEAEREMIVRETRLLDYPEELLYPVDRQLELQAYRLGQHTPTSALLVDGQQMIVSLTGAAIDIMRSLVQYSARENAIDLLQTVSRAVERTSRWLQQLQSDHHRPIDNQGIAVTLNGMVLYRVRTAQDA